MNHDYDFTGKVALVTGSSRGIGAGIVAALGQRGARCVVNYVADADGRNQADAGALAAALPEAIAIQCDVSDAAQVSEMMSQVRHKFGGLDILVNNAGILRDRTIKKMSEAEWESVLRVNLNGAFHCIHHATEILRPDGRIVNIASVSGQLGVFGQANYASSKAGVIALTKVAARELARRQITVNAVAPGFIDTEMTRAVALEARERMTSVIPLGRLGTPEDVAAGILFLVSPQASYVTGEVLNISGGLYM